MSIEIEKHERAKNYYYIMKNFSMPILASKDELIELRDKLNKMELLNARNE